ncbi:hypothetical protein Tco_1025858 [Tanacetum coccineum]
MLKEYNDCINQRADELPIMKISYRVSSSNNATMRITRVNDPLNVVVHDKFRLKRLGFSEWLEVHALAFKTKSKSNDQLAKTSKPNSSRKTKRRSKILQEVFVKENIVVDGMHRNLAPPSGIEGRRGLVIRELEAGIFYYNGNFYQTSTGIKGLNECKASASNLRRIQVKDIVKEVEDHLKTYSSAEMDIIKKSILLEDHSR